MGSILGLLTDPGELVGSVLQSILGGGSSNSSASSDNPLSSLLGGQDGIASGGGSGGGLSTLMSIASLAAMFA